MEEDLEDFDAQFADELEMMQEINGEFVNSLFMNHGPRMTVSMAVLSIHLVPQTRDIDRPLCTDIEYLFFPSRKCQVTQVYTILLVV